MLINLLQHQQILNEIIHIRRRMRQDMNDNNQMNENIMSIEFMENHTTIIQYNEPNTSYINSVKCR